MNSELVNLLKKYGLPALALVVAFAAGRWTMRSSVEKEAESKYEAQLHEETSRIETEWKQKLVDETASLRKQLQEVTTKNVVTDKKTTTKPDGTTIVEEHTKISEKNKKNETVAEDKKKTEQTNEGSNKQEQTKKDEKVTETVKTVEKIIPPPSWRVYGVAALSRPTDDRKASYGAGTMYDLGPVNVGGFGLYSPEGKDTTIGLTVGISF